MYVDKENVTRCASVARKGKLKQWNSGERREKRVPEKQKPELSDTVRTESGWL